MTKKIVMTSDDIRRTLARIAHEILERNQTVDDLVLVGMHTRGVPLARRLSDNIQKFESREIPVGTLDATSHRDDLASLGKRLVLKPTDIPVDIENKCIILVDDVLYTGRTVRAAMDALVELGRPKAIQFVVLIDRGHREMPIRADYVGKNIPTSRLEEIQVRLVETDGADEVFIVSPGGDSPERAEKLAALRKE